MHDSHDQPCSIDITDFNETLPICSPKWDMKTLKISASKTLPFLRYSIYSRGILRWKNEDDRFSTHPLYISPLFNNNVFCYEILWIYTTMGTLHIDTLKTILRRVKQYRASVIGLTYPPTLWSGFLSVMSDLWARALELSTTALHLSESIFKTLGLWFSPE